MAFALFPLLGYQGIFYLSLIPGAVAVIVLLLFVRDIYSPKKVRLSILSNLKVVLAEKRFILLLIVMALFSAGAFNFSFVIVRASDLGVPENMVLLIYALINTAHTLIGFPAGILSDKIGRETMLAVSYGIFLVSTIMMITSTESSHAYLIAVVFGAYIGIAETVQRALVPKYIPSQYRGTAYGLYNMIVGFAFLAANIIFGYLFDSSGIYSAATYSITTSAAALGALFIFQVLTRAQVKPS
jgi:MFS family permease